MTELRRTLSLPLVILYGIGVTIGAGIYALLGVTAGKAGLHAPMSFVLASVVMVFSAASFAELSSRFPVSAGEAEYVRSGFRSKPLGLLVGCLVIASGTVSSAAIAVGSTGYIREFIGLDALIILPVVVVLVGALAAWGIRESVMFASVFTLVEVGALAAIIAFGFWQRPGMIAEIPGIFPSPAELDAWVAISSASLLAFFAFIGFEDIVNLAEEVEEPNRVLPRAILATLVISTVLYFLVTTVAVLSVPLGDLAASDAPLSLVFGSITGASPVVITSIAIVATLNGVVIQMIMASRVLYGLGRQGAVPAAFASVHPRTQTPLIATSTIIAVVLVLALMFPIEALAEWTARIVLFVFTLANAALVRMKLRGEAAPDGVFTVGIWVPIAGVLSCLALLAGDLFI
ncbi:amino acid permease [Thalassobaculum sp.]|uniref:APC family permease n=1 Tax=Thalassobaculum sp. TaxID=2022740 RepID=UPI0032ECAD06